MTYKTSNSLVFGRYKVVLDLSGFTTAINIDDTNIHYDDSVQVVLDLFSISELERFEVLSENSKKDLFVKIAQEKMVDVISKYKGAIDFDYSPAGIPELIVRTIHSKSIEVLSDLEGVYKTYKDNINVISVMGAVVSRYLNIPYSEVITYPIHEVIRLHAICATTFPEVVSFVKEDE